MAILKRVILIGALALLSGAQAAGQAGGASQGVIDWQNQKAQNDLTNAQTDLLNTWTQCMQTVNDTARCGPAPTISTPAPQYRAPQPPPYVPPRRIDYQCMSDCQTKGYGHPADFCRARCSY